MNDNPQNRVYYNYRYFLPHAPAWGDAALCLRRLRELLTFCRQACVDAVQFFVNTRFGTYYMPPRGAEEQREWAQWMKADVAPALRRAGLSYQLNFQMLLGANSMDLDLRDQYDWDFLVDQHGVEALGCACPLSPRFRTAMGAMLRLWADTQPEVIWIDDDFRMHNHGLARHGLDFYCYCDLHLAAFALSLRSPLFPRGSGAPGAAPRHAVLATVAVVGFPGRHNDRNGGMDPSGSAPGLAPHALGADDLRPGCACGGRPRLARDALGSVRTTPPADPSLFGLLHGDHRGAQIADRFLPVYGAEHSDSRASAGRGPGRVCAGIGEYPVHYLEQVLRQQRVCFDAGRNSWAVRRLPCHCTIWTDPPCARNPRRRLCCGETSRDSRRSRTLTCATGGPPGWFWSTIRSPRAKFMWRRAPGCRIWGCSATGTTSCSRWGFRPIMPHRRPLPRHAT